VDLAVGIAVHAAPDSHSVTPRGGAHAETAGFATLPAQGLGGHLAIVQR
jgi:hypothetical protein